MISSLRQRLCTQQQLPPYLNHKLIQHRRNYQVQLPALRQKYLFADTSVCKSKSNSAFSQDKKNSFYQKSMVHLKQNSLKTGQFNRPKRLNIRHYEFNDYGLSRNYRFEQKSFSKRKEVSNKNPYSRVKQVHYKTSKGLRSHNEDRIHIEKNMLINQKKYEFFAVYDGHGGPQTADFLKVRFTSMFQRQMKESQSIGTALKQAIIQCDSQLAQLPPKYNSKNSGSCLLVCIIHQEKIHIANVGDSRAILCDPLIGAKCLTEDHRPSNCKESARIEAAGGRVYRQFLQKGNNTIYGPFRIQPGRLSVSRSIGDLLTKKNPIKALINTPDIYEHQIRSGTILLLMTDGIYQKVDQNTIAQCFNCRNICEGVQLVVRVSIAAGMGDNGSLIGISFK